MTSELTCEGEKKALESLLFITKKQNENIKGRTVRDGSKQRTNNGYDKSDGSLPTMITNSIFFTGVVDEREGRATVILNVVKAFLHADSVKYILMLLCGKLAELMVKVDLSLYRKYTTTSKNGVPMMYTQLSKAFYGMLRAALLFYTKLRSDLENMGFEIFPYELYVTNKMVNGNQMTVCCHINNQKVSHIDKNAVTTFALKLTKIYGLKTTISCRKVH